MEHTNAVESAKTPRVVHLKSISLRGLIPSDNGSFAVRFPFQGEVENGSVGLLLNKANSSEIQCVVEDQRGKLKEVPLSTIRELNPELTIEFPMESPSTNPVIDLEIYREQFFDGLNGGR